MASIIAQFKKIADAFSVGIETAVQEAAAAAEDELLARTPVKTGTARINWIASVGTPKSHEESGPGSSSRATNAGVARAAAASRAAAVIRRFRLSHGSIFLCNSVPYINDLDAGSSTQAPAGMTSFAVKAATDVLVKAKIL